MAAKEAGELPQASQKDLELQETVRKKAQEEKALALQAQNGQLPKGRKLTQNGQAAQTK